MRRRRRRRKMLDHKYYKEDINKDAFLFYFIHHFYSLFLLALARIIKNLYEKISRRQHAKPPNESIKCAVK
jgi:hypothetical protein